MKFKIPAQRNIRSQTRGQQEHRTPRVKRRAQKQRRLDLCEHKEVVVVESEEEECGAIGGSDTWQHTTRTDTAYLRFSFGSSAWNKGLVNTADG